MNTTNKAKKFFLNAMTRWKFKPIDKYRNGKVIIKILKLRPITVIVNIESDFATWGPSQPLILQVGKTLEIDTKIEIKLSDY